MEAVHDVHEKVIFERCRGQGMIAGLWNWASNPSINKELGYEWWLLSSFGKTCLVWIFILIFLARATKQSESMVMVGSEMDGWGLEQRGLGGWWCGAGGGSQNTGAGASALRGLPPAPPLHRGSGSPRKKGRILKETYNFKIKPEIVQRTRKA